MVLLLIWHFSKASDRIEELSPLALLFGCHLLSLEPWENGTDIFALEFDSPHKVTWLEGTSGSGISFRFDTSFQGFRWLLELSPLA